MKWPNRPADPSATLIGPDCLEIGSRRMKAGNVWLQTIAVVGYPREVGPGWTALLLTYPGLVDVSLHIEPVPNEIAVNRLRRQSAKFESTRRIESGKGRLPDPVIEAAATDSADLMSAVARGESRLFRVGLYLTVRASTKEAVETEAEKLRTLCASLLLDARPVPFRSFEGWVTTLPLGLDAIRLRRTFDTEALSMSFPFAGSELEGKDGVLFGCNAATGGPIFVDRFALDNHNQVILAHSGKGKSYLAKLQILRSLYQGVDVLVVDPENEYGRLAESVGGTVLRLGPGGDAVNPLDLAEAGSAGALERQAQFVHTLVESMLGSLPKEHRAVLDKALLAAYEQAGITFDVRSHVRPAPSLSDVLRALRDARATQLAERLEPYISGSFRGLFEGPKTADSKSHLVVFSLRDVPHELKAPATLLALETIWRTVARGEIKRRVVVVDEAWLLLQTDAGARFLERLARSARKYLCGLTTITQDVRDALATHIGHAVVTNASSQVILGQHPQAIEQLGDAFGLSKGERSYLLTCPRGEGLLCVGTDRVPLRIVASKFEHSLASSQFASDPEGEEA